MFKTRCKHNKLKLTVVTKRLFSGTAEEKIRCENTGYGVSLLYPNKQFQIKQVDRDEQIFECLENIWTVRIFFIDNFGIDPLIVSDDQMPQHRNESSTQNTLNFKCMDIYVKENNNLSRE